MASTVVGSRVPSMGPGPMSSFARSCLISWIMAALSEAGCAVAAPVEEAPVEAVLVAVVAGAAAAGALAGAGVELGAAPGMTLAIRVRTGARIGSSRPCLQSQTPP